MDLNTFSLEYIISMRTKEEEGESKFLKVEGVLILIGVVAKTKKESSHCRGHVLGRALMPPFKYMFPNLLGFVTCTEDMLSGLK